VDFYYTVQVLFVEALVIDLYKMPRLYFYRWILWWFQPIYRRMFKLRATGLENVPREGSYLLVGNHSHKLDPFFIGAMIRRPIFQIASNEYFRIPLMRRFMWAMGAFPMRKDAKESKPIRYAKQIVKKGHPLGIYPEGGRNWDGQTLPILNSTAKLVKLLDIPVVAVVSKGNYLAWPRWADRKRKSIITIHYAKPVTFDRATKDEEIINWIQKAIDHSDNETRMENIRGKRPAEGLNRLLWRCPACRTLEGLEENGGESVACKACGREWEVNLECRMREMGSDSWKPIKEYADLMFKADEILPIKHPYGDHLEKGEEVFLQSGTTVLYHEPWYPKLKKVGEGTLLLTNRGLLFIRMKNNKITRFTFEGIRGRSTEKNFIFQILYRTDTEFGSAYDIGRFEMRRESCLKWELFYDHVRRKSGCRTEEDL
jgi:1-acyl-sn-glycerol-3-phosphate acyltransferase